MGLLCITFDDSKYRDVTKAIMSLCHPDELLQENSFEYIEDLKMDQNAEVFGRDIKEVFEITMKSILKNRDIPVEHLKKDEKVKIVAALKEKGVFLLKGAVTEVAKQLDSSEATIYRYLNEVEEMEKIR